MEAGWPQEMLAHKSRMASLSRVSYNVKVGKVMQSCTLLPGCGLSIKGCHLTDGKCMYCQTQFAHAIHNHHTLKQVSINWHTTVSEATSEVQYSVKDITLDCASPLLYVHHKYSNSVIAFHTSLYIMAAPVDMLNEFLSHQAQLIYELEAKSELHTCIIITVGDFTD